jgi:flagellar hook-length control protein FliK
VIVEAGPGPGGGLFRRGDADAPVRGSSAAFLSVMTEDGTAELPSFGGANSLLDASVPEIPSAEDGAAAVVRVEDWLPMGLPPNPAAAPGPLARLPAAPAAVAAVARRDEKGAPAPVPAETVDPPDAVDPPAAFAAAATEAEEAARPSLLPAPAANGSVLLRATAAIRGGDAPDAPSERREDPASAPGAGTAVPSAIRPAGSAAERAAPDTQAGDPAAGVEVDGAGYSAARVPGVQRSSAAETRADKAVAAEAVDVAGAPASILAETSAGVTPVGATAARADVSAVERAGVETVGLTRPPAITSPALARLVPPVAFVSPASARQAVPSEREGAVFVSAKEATATPRQDLRDPWAAPTGASSTPVPAASAGVQSEPAPQQQTQPAAPQQQQAQPAPEPQAQPRMERELREASPDPGTTPEIRESIPSTAIEKRSALREAAAKGPAVQPQMAETTAGGLPDADLSLPLAVADVATRPAIEVSAALPPALPGLSADQTGSSVAQQLVAAVLSSGEGGFEIQLSPEELGRVTLSLQVTDDSVVLSIQADRQDTLDLMRRNTDILLREFREAGFASLSFAFGQGSAEGRPARVPAHAGPLQDRVAAASAAPSPAAAGRAPSSNRLDLRL